MTEIFKRIATTFTLVSLLFLLFIYGTNLSFIVIIYLITVLSFYEWLRLTSKPIYFIFPFFILLALLDFSKTIDIYFLSLLVLLLVVITASLTFSHESYLRIKIKQYSTFFGTFITVSFFLFLINLYPYDNTLQSHAKLIDNKHYYIILISLVSFIDMSAYICGKLIGRNRITSSISPNKTYEGYFGSLIFTFMFFILVSYYLSYQYTYLDIFILLLFIVSVFYGDLLMSLVKRIFEVKDSGSLLPGHGGLLDRLDGYFTSLPIFYLWFLF
tara:strand:- start:542 stop:1354 length:813 start_codon:yes stop_codon:yes gene_type:complete